MDNKDNLEKDIIEETNAEAINDEETIENKVGTKSSKPWIVLILILLLGLGATYYFINEKNNNKKVETNNKDKEVQDEENGDETQPEMDNDIENHIPTNEEIIRYNDMKFSIEKQEEILIKTILYLNRYRDITGNSNITKIFVDEISNLDRIYLIHNLYWHGNKNHYYIGGEDANKASLNHFGKNIEYVDEYNSSDYPYNEINNSDKTTKIYGYNKELNYFYYNDLSYKGSPSFGLYTYELSRKEDNDIITVVKAYVTGSVEPFLEKTALYKDIYESDQIDVDQKYFAKIKYSLSNEKTVYEANNTLTDIDGNIYFKNTEDENVVYDSKNNTYEIRNNFESEDLFAIEVNKYLKDNLDKLNRIEYKYKVNNGRFQFISLELK